jgi:hypothetical protein
VRYLLEVRLPNENRNPEPIFYLSGLIEALESGPWPKHAWWKLKDFNFGSTFSRVFCATLWVLVGIDDCDYFLKYFLFKKILKLFFYFLKIIFYISVLK